MIRSLATFQNASIKHKVVLLILMISAVGVWLACATFLGHEFLTFRGDLLKQTTTLAEMVGYHSSAALTFENSDEAARTLRSLELDPNVAMAAIYDRKGKPVSAYVQPERKQPPVPQRIQASGRFENGYLHVFRPISFQGEVIGTAYVRASLQPLWDRVRLYVTVSILLLIGTLLATWWLAERFQRVVSQPVFNLVSTAKEVAGKKDYSLRAGKEADDELGYLVDEFNHMLAEIQARDAELENARRDLEKRVEERTSDLKEQVAHVERAQAELRKQEELVRNVLDLVPSLIMVKDSNGRYTLVNRAMSDLFRCRPDVMIGKTDGDFHHRREDVERFALDDREVLHSGLDKFIPEEPVTNAEGRLLWVQTVKRLLKSSSGERQVLVVATDITARKDAELEMVRAKEAAEAANRAKSEFLANMSHEIRTPLNGIIGMTNLLLETDLATEQRDFAETIASSSDSLLTILSDILDISKIEAGKLTFESIPFDVRQTVESTVDLLASRAHEKGLELGCLIENNVAGRLKGDPTRLRQVLLNLIGNAIKFTEKGEVFVHVSVLGNREDDQELYFEVRDTGVGVRPEVKDRLFQAFVQADGSTTRKYGGTGLGLYISKQLVEMMGGSIALESEWGKGSTFGFTGIFDHAGETEAAPQLPGVSVMLISDNESLVRAASHYLEGARATVMRCQAGDPAVRLMEAAAREGRGYEVAIIDSTINGISGSVLGRQIGENPWLRESSVLLLTGVSNDTVEDYTGALPCVPKPLKRDVLLNSIQKLVGSTAGPAKRAAGEPGVGQRQPNGRRILVAEDNVVNQRLAMRLVEKLGYAVDVVGDGLKAVAAVKALSYDAVLMDCQMPEMDGYEATRVIRRTNRGLPIIAMTANAMQGDREKCLAAGMTDYVSKPIKVSELQAAIERSLKATAGC